ncbi:hypothetical protein JXA12_01765 [Candidatus Woesearchaeota archaeon]|nr:hypothetical protein [Candidatus Woesearchaeota archaeon]
MRCASWFLVSLLLVAAVIAAQHPVHQGFSQAHDVLFDDGSLLIADTAVFHQGWYSVGGGGWVSFELSGASLGSHDEWLAGEASASLPSFGSGEHYVLVYSCSLVERAWDCHGGQWQLLIINNSGLSSVGPDYYWDFDGGVGLGTIHGAAVVQDPGRGGVLFLDGVDDYLDAGSFSVVGDALSVAAWFNIDSVPSDQDPRVISKGDSTGYQDWALLVSRDGYPEFRYHHGSSVNDGQVRNQEIQVSPGVWHHVAGVFDGGEATLYFDGVPVASRMIVGGLEENGHAVWLGGQGVDPLSRPFPGMIDDVSIFSSALTDEEVLLLYEEGVTVVPTCSDGVQNQDETGVDCGGSCPLCLDDLPSGLVSWWPLDGDGRDVVGDNHGTPSSTLAAVSSGCKSGRCYLFDGDDDFILLDRLNSQDDGTYSFWISRSADLSDDRLVLSRYSSYSRIFLRRDNAAFRLETDTNGQEMQLSSAYAPPADTLTHVVLVKDGDRLTLYLDGAYQAQSTVAGADGFTFSQIGSEGRSFRGVIDEVMVWDRPLTAAEVGVVFGIEAECGNGVTEPPETCDGDCPSSCNDGDPCTTETLTGSPASCDVVCVPAAVTACTSYDGCCPSGCTSSNDNDCSVPVSGDHPFLFFSAADVPSLQAKVAKSGSLSAAAFSRLHTGTVSASGDYWDHELVELSLKYALTGSGAYGDAAVASMKNIMYACDPDTCVPMYDDRMYGDDMWGWSMAVAYDLVYDHLTSAERAQVKSWLEGMAHWHWEHLNDGKASTSNFWSGGWASLGMICLVLHDETDDALIKGTYFTTAVSRINTLFNTAAWSSYEPHGFYNDGHGYATYGGPQEFLFAYAYERYLGKDFVTGGYAYNAPLFFAYAHTTDNGMPNYGDNTQKPGTAGKSPDNYYTSRMPPYALVPIALSEDPVWRWFWSFSNPGLTSQYGYYPEFYVVLFYPEDYSSVSPEVARLPDSYFFKDHSGKGGFLGLRTGWDDVDEITAWVTTRYARTQHMHYDANGFSLTAYGDRFYTDEQQKPYTEKGRGNVLEHNTIVIDDHESPEVPSNDFYSSEGQIIGFTSGSGGTVARGEASVPYADRSVPYPPFQKANRIFSLVNGEHAPPYLVTIDQVRKDSSTHKYEWRVHTYKTVTGSGAIGDPFVLDGSSADLYVYFVQPESFSGTIGTYYSSYAGLTHNLALAVQNGVEAHFFTVHYPRRSGMPLPVITSGSSASGTWATLDWGGDRKDYLLERKSSSYSANGVATDALFAAVRTTGSTVEALLLEEGKSLSFSGTALFSVTSSGPVSASSSRTGPVASVDGLGVSSLRLYAPAADTLLLNGKSVPFTRSGGFVVYG